MLSKLAYAVMVSEYVPAVPYLPGTISCPPPDSGSAGGGGGNIGGGSGGGNIGGGSGGGNNSGGGSGDGPLVPRCSQVIGRICDEDGTNCLGWPLGIHCIP